MKRIVGPVLIAAVFAVATLVADGYFSDFETFVPGTVHNQDGWSSSGSAGSGCAVYDHAVAANVWGFASFGSQSLRISNAVTSGCFGDQTFSSSLDDAAGETTATTGGHSNAPTSAYFAASWDFASTMPTSEQPGLSVVVSPDRGDGARMSWIQMVDTPAGLEVNFYDYQVGATVDPFGCCPPFVGSHVAQGLDRTVPHNVMVTMELLEGPANDVVNVYVDGVLMHTGTSWEDYFRENEDGNTRTVDSLLFRTAGAAEPGTAGYGFAIDNLVLSSDVPTDPEQCKKGGWANFVPAFKNQGQCVSSVVSHRP